MDTNRLIIPLGLSKVHGTGHSFPTNLFSNANLTVDIIELFNEDRARIKRNLKLDSLDAKLIDVSSCALFLLNKTGSEPDDYFISHGLTKLVTFATSIVLGVTCDMELGGNDQRFNLLVGRDMQRSYKQKESQVIMTVPLLEGIDGINKMSKSLNNYIAVEDVPKEMFGKTMRLSDELMMKYYELLTDVRPDELADLRNRMKAGSLNPRDVKVALAKIFVERFHSKEAAVRAETEFKEIFANKGVPNEIPEWATAAASGVLICKLMVEAGLSASNSEARRLIEGGGVEFEGVRVTDPKHLVDLKAGEKPLLKVGKKKFIRIVAR
jgi:tyrosyl-tRNA synthetase